MFISPNYISFLLALLCSSNPATAKELTCESSEIERPDYFGTEIINVVAKQINGFEDWSMAEDVSLPLNRDPMDFCSVTITYTHPGLNDTVNVFIWLPQKWNGNFLGQGGGSWTAGFENWLAPGVSLGCSL